MLLTQKIRQTVLTRSGAVANAAREPQLTEEDADAAEVMDLTDKKKPPKTVLTSIVPTSTSQSLPESSNVPPPGPLPLVRSKHSKILRDHEYLQQQRELLYMQSSQVS